MSELVEGESDEEGKGAADDVGTHLDGLESGAGCTEIWEHLSEQREND